MDKIAKVPHLREELDWLDQTYGVEKEGFFHQEHWQLLVAIMLSAQSTDKQVDEVLPKLYGRFPTVQEIAQATEEEIREEIKSVGLYKSKAKHIKSCCMQLAEQYGGEVPTTIEELVKLAGKNPVETEQELMRVLPKDHWNRINFQLIYHGRSICTARKAKCSECGLQAWCEKRVEKKQA